jgi:hypothetical protein
VLIVPQAAAAGLVRAAAVEEWSRKVARKRGRHRAAAHDQEQAAADDRERAAA